MMNHEDFAESKSSLVDSEAASQTVIDEPLIQITTGSDEAEQNIAIDCLCSPQMEEEHRQSSNEFPINEIPDPVKVLDDIISEFEDTSKPASANGGENQSEDDGYMSLSRKNMHKKDFENMSKNSIANAAPETLNRCFLEFDHSFIHSGDCTKENEKAADISKDQNIIQSTLPKARPTSMPKTTTNYSSLPCCGVRSGSMENKIRGGGSCNGERNVLGIDISAVHNAVIRGGLAKLPEPILNEHPVTIYPGRYSPPTDGIRGNRPLRLLSSVEKHKEVCQILNPLSSISPSSSSSSSSSHSNSAACSSDIKTLEASPTKKLYKETAEYKNCRSTESENYEFSDDSIEEQPISPLKMPSFISTSQLTPKKQCGIAWEIHFNSSNNNKKMKSSSSLSSRRKSGRKHMDDNINSENELLLPEYVKPDENELHNESTINIAVIEDEDYTRFDDGQENPNSNGMFSYGMYSHTNMLGKGTFIIRRATKSKPLPKAIDTFSDTTLVSNRIQVDHTDSNECNRNDYSPIDSNDIHKTNDNDILNTNRKRNPDIKENPQNSLFSYPRDRLSLNLESQHNNSLKKEATSTLSEDFTKSCNKGSLKIDRNQCNSLDEASLCDIVKTSVANNFDSGAMFPYKSNNSNGLKNQEYSDLRTSNTTTPHTDLAPTLEEEEDQYSDQFSYGCAPLQQIESNISALLRGEITVVRAGDTTVNAIAGAGAVIGTAAHPKRPLEFRPGVHKSESAKEMLLSQNAFGPLPPSPPSSNPDLFDYDALPPLPPSPAEIVVDNNDLPKAYMKATTTTKTSVEIHSQSQPLADERRDRDNISALRHLTSDLPLPPPPPPFDTLPPAVPPHRGHSANTMKSWSIDSNYKRKSPKMLGGYGSGSSITTPTGSHAPSCEGGSYSTKRYVSYGTKRSLKQSPREELRLQTSCSLPETPIFARGCDIPRTPFRRQNENTVNGSRTAPRSSTSHSINMGTSIVGIAGGNTFGSGMCRQRSINHALASNEMLRLSGVPARGWYPKQRSMRPASTENIDRLTSIRVWDSASGMSSTGHARKPLTLPPNLTPSFLNKSPREALRRVTSLLITKKKNTKERKTKITYDEIPMERNNIVCELDTSTSTKDTIRACNNTAQKPHKKKGIFKNLWKRTKHFSLDQ